MDISALIGGAVVIWLTGYVLGFAIKAATYLPLFFGK
jgi:hypothetical protein